MQAQRIPNPPVNSAHWEEDFEIPPEHYYTLDSPLPAAHTAAQPPAQSHSHILAQQNHIYAQMEKNHEKKKQEELKR